MSRRWAATAAGAALLALAGCGDDPTTGGGGSGETPPPAGEELEAGAATDEGNVRDAVISYYRALGNEDYAGACERLSQGAQRRLKRVPRATGGCEETLRRALEDVGEAELQRLRNANVSSVVVGADRARARVQGQTLPVRLQREGSQWVIAEFVEAPS